MLKGKKTNLETAKKVEETSGRATEEGSLSQDGQTCNTHMHVHKRTTESRFTSCTDRISDSNDLTQCVDPGGRLSRPRHRQEGRSHKIISSKTEKSRVKRHPFYRNTDIRR